MTIYALGDQIPDIHPDAFVHPDATVIGSVTIGAGASVWPAAVLRGDYGRIEIGARTSVQDGTVVHTTEQWPTIVGADSIIGHNVHVEGCTVANRCLIGSGSIVLNRAVVDSGAAVGAAALVPEGMHIPAGQIALGVPARLRPGPPDLATWVAAAVDIYLAGAARYRSQLRRIR
jgi:carbonic anhydrase/acetyltransferase-like protein (isoleucine patch superfamily)